MNNLSCEDCKWDRNPQNQRMIVCGQGHSRLGGVPTKYCHAWERKVKCWCEFEHHSASIQSFDNGGIFIYFKAIFCPQCGKRLEVK
jgi:hypothetical protein